MVLNGRTTVSIAGQPVALASDRLLASELWIEAPEGNVGVVCVGGRNVVAHEDAHNSLELHPGDRAPVLRHVMPADVFVDARNDGDAVVWMGF
ncbi:MAG: hypothetical protein U0990_09420 [Candidatus Nanopelagicales bacterium]|nr:hypothetical protein [Candidatus Nanopelagicales bacterium]